MSVSRPRPVIPEELPKLLHGLSYAVIKNNPQDIIGFAAEHFQQLLNEREKDNNAPVKKENDQEFDGEERNQVEDEDRVTAF